MCGIVGCKLNRPLTAEDINILRNLRSSLTHRGPDDEGEHIVADQGLYLGHRRLAIIDLNRRSVQPMQREGFVLSFNGQIYNYRELKIELEKEFKFETTSDTEVLLRAWQFWGGDKALKNFDGMYAISLYDSKDLHLVTDIFGEKPIYTYENQDGLYFCSEATPLIKQFNLVFDPTDREKHEFFFLNFIQSPHTGFVGLKTLPPATWLQIKPDGSYTSHRYWQISEGHWKTGKIKPISKQDHETIKSLICKSIKRRLQSDVPLGLFLSSGIDSTLIAALTKKELNIDLQAYTVEFPGMMNEASCASQIADYLDLDHTIIRAQDNFHGSNPIARITELFGIPNANLTALFIEQMCKKAKNQLTVALSGTGGDELFLGYNKYATIFKNQFFYKNAQILSLLLSIVSFLPVQKLRLASDLLCLDETRQYLRLKNGKSQKSMEEYFKAKYDIFPNYQGSLLSKVRYFDFDQVLPQSILSAMDRASMRASVEVRSPFLNKELYEFCMGLDQRSMIAFGPKSVLKNILQEYIPLSFLNPKKQGFTSPIGTILNETGSFQEQIFPEDLTAELANNFGDPTYQNFALKLLMFNRLMG